MKVLDEWEKNNNKCYSFLTSISFPVRFETSSSSHLKLRKKILNFANISGRLLRPNKVLTGSVLITVKGIHSQI